MGHDFITYEGDHELFDDFDLWTLRHFLIEEARTMEAADAGAHVAALRAFIEKWDWLGPGVFTGTDLTVYISKSRRRWELLLQLLQHAGDRIAEFGELVPLDYLTAHVNTATARFTQAQPTRRYLVCIGRICALLSKHEPQSA
jgi:hypothetical protein